MFCPKCGNQQPDGTRFCGVCGAPLGAPTTGAPAGGAPTPGAFVPPQQPFSPAGARGASGVNVYGLIAAVVAVLAVVFLNQPWLTVSGFGASMELTVGQMNDYVGRLAGLASSFGGSSSSEVGMVTFFLGLLNVLVIVSMIVCVLSAVVRVAALVPSPDVQGLVAKVPAALHTAAGSLVCLDVLLWLVGLMIAAEGLEAFEVVGVGTYLSLIAGVALIVLNNLAAKK